MRRRSVWVFWGLLALCLLLSLDRIFADPDGPDTANSAPGGAVVISEFSAVNGGELADEDGDFSDWIELHNRSLLPVNLADWTLTDDPGQRDKWTFGEVTLAPGDYLIVFASGKSRRTLAPEEGRPYLHTNFRLSSEGGYLALFPPTSRHFIDASVYEYPAQLPGHSFGLIAEGGEQVTRFLAQPTPGAANDGTEHWAGVLPEVKISAGGGYFTAPFSVTLAPAAASPPGAVIRYTTDGSTPTEQNGIVYTGPVAITRTTPLRASAFLTGYRPSPPPPAPISLCRMCSPSRRSRLAGLQRGASIASTVAPIWPERRSRPTTPWTRGWSTIRRMAPCS
ncbi:MAG TPA: chitobiase/beta-hexosaminidase C-terminal domain-containing protein [Caldilineaceae bacterium]|nr:chitobiase/beta-hexosaminidase C-terminal domain-containing protein [Caldilineaceae bacterium]